MTVFINSSHCENSPNSPQGVLFGPLMKNTEDVLETTVQHIAAGVTDAFTTHLSDVHVDSEKQKAFNAAVTAIVREALAMELQRKRNPGKAAARSKSPV